MSLSDTALHYLYNRQGHAVVVHNNRIVVWGSYNSATGVFSSPGEILVYDPNDLSWTTRVTTGEIPPPFLTHFTAHSVGDEMYVLFGIDQNWDVDARRVLVLNLNSLVWRRLEAAGDDVPTDYHFDITWLHGEGNNNNNIVVLSKESQGLFVYSTKDNVWWKPTCKGCLSSVAPHFERSAFVVGSKAYILGGVNSEDNSCGLSRLDMDTWTWETMTQDDPGSTHPAGWIANREGHTMTLLPSSQPDHRRRVLLYGGLFDDDNVSSQGNCWILHLDDGLSYRWQRCDHLDVGESIYHRAVVEMWTGQVWIIGGFRKSARKGILKLTVTRPLSLVMSAFKAMLEEREGRLRKGITELPQRLQSMFRNYVESE